jgi:hypothetical protein
MKDENFKIICKNDFLGMDGIAAYLIRYPNFKKR